MTTARFWSLTVRLAILAALVWLDEHINHIVRFGHWKRWRCTLSVLSGSQSSDSSLRELVYQPRGNHRLYKYHLENGVVEGKGLYIPYGKVKAQVYETRVRLGKRSIKIISVRLRLCLHYHALSDYWLATRRGYQECCHAEWMSASDTFIPDKKLIQIVTVRLSRSYGGRVKRSFEYTLCVLSTVRTWWRWWILLW